MAKQLSDDSMQDRLNHLKNEAENHLEFAAQVFDKAAAEMRLIANRVNANFQNPEYNEVDYLTEAVSYCTSSLLHNLHLSQMSQVAVRLAVHRERMKVAETAKKTA